MFFKNEIYCQFEFNNTISQIFCQIYIDFANILVSKLQHYSFYINLMRIILSENNTSIIKYTYLKICKTISGVAQGSNPGPL